MYKNVLVPIDKTKLSEIAIDEALNVIDLSDPKSKIILLNIIEIYPITRKDKEIEEKNITNKTQKYIQPIKKKLEKKVPNIEIAIRSGRNPADEICKYANSFNVDVVVIASRGMSGFMQWTLGSYTEKIIKNCTKPILIKTCPGVSREPYLQIDELPGL